MVGDVLAAAATPWAAAPSWPQQVGADFTHFTEAYVTPLQGLTTAILMVTAGVLLSARVAPLLVRTWPLLGDTRERGTVLGTGVLATALCALLVTAGTADVASSPIAPGTWAAMILGVVTLAVAAALWSRGSRCAVGRGTPADAWFRTPLSSTGLAAAAIVVALLVLVPLGIGTASPLAVLALGILCGAAAVALLGWWLATRLRLSITVKKADGTDDPAGAALVSALLGELGASPPRGLEVPTGADATELTDALAAIPGAGSIATRVGAFLSGLLGATPWRAEVVAGESDALTVRLSRSGHSTGSAVIRPAEGRDRTGTSTPARDLQRLAAAFLLTTLSDHHGEFPGLVGATSWRSLGLHYIATTELGGEAKLEALARASAIDPENGLAATAWRHALWRHSTEPAELTEYLRWLARFQGRHDDPALAALRLRTAYTRAVIALNRSFLLPAPAAQPAVAEYEALIGELRALLDDPDLTGELGPLTRQIATATACLPPGLNGGFGPPADTVEAPTPTAMYNLGCWWASCDPPDHDRAAELLRRALTLPSLRGALADDPQLAGFLGTPQYRSAFLAAPRTDFFELAPVMPYARILTTLGYTAPESLAPADSDPNLLLALGLAGRTRITGLAALCQRLAAADDLQDARIEILHELSARRLLTPADLAAVDVDARDAVTTAVAVSIGERCKPFEPALTAAAIRAWWDTGFPP